VRGRGVLCPGLDTGKGYTGRAPSGCGGLTRGGSGEPKFLTVRRNQCRRRARKVLYLEAALGEAWLDGWRLRLARRRGITTAVNSGLRRGEVRPGLG
jgi:hypothetical protein